MSKSHEHSRKVVTASAAYVDHRSPIVIAKCPRTAAANKLSGSGRYLLLSCDDGISRRGILFDTPMARNRVLRRWNGGDYPGATSTCGVEGCNGDHIGIDFLGED